MYHSQRDEEPCDYFRFTEHSLRYLLEKIGFVIDKIESNGGKRAVCGQVIVHRLRGSRLEMPLITKVINKLFAYLDDRHKIEGNPMNYVVADRELLLRRVLLPAVLRL